MIEKQSKRTTVKMPGSSGSLCTSCTWSGFRNRLLVLLNWAFYYFLHERQVRLITLEGEGGSCK
jgi:hypothetical protein